MKSLKDVERQLAKIGHFNQFFARAEVKELPNILTQDEEMIAVVNGRYHNGFALLVATNYRLLLVDKKPLFLNMEDTRYDMISEVDFINQLIDSVLSIRTINKTLVFKSIKKRKLREITTLIQQKVMELRQNQSEMQESPGQQLPALQPNQYENTEQVKIPEPALAQQQPLVRVDKVGSVAQPSLEQSIDLGALALTQRPRGIRRFSPITSQPLTIRRPTTGAYANPFETRR